MYLVREVGEGVQKGLLTLTQVPHFFLDKYNLGAVSLQDGGYAEAEVGLRGRVYVLPASQSRRLEGSWTFGVVVSGRKYERYKPGHQTRLRSHGGEVNADQKSLTNDVAVSTTTTQTLLVPPSP
jgi:hypothetical protein